MHSAPAIFLRALFSDAGRWCPCRVHELSILDSRTWRAAPSAMAISYVFSLKSRGVFSSRSQLPYRKISCQIWPRRLVDLLLAHLLGKEERSLTGWMSNVYTLGQPTYFLAFGKAHIFHLGTGSETIVKLVIYGQPSSACLLLILIMKGRRYSEFKESSAPGKLLPPHTLFAANGNLF